MKLNILIGEQKQSALSPGLSAGGGLKLHESRLQSPARDLSPGLSAGGGLKPPETRLRV